MFNQLHTVLLILSAVTALGCEDATGQQGSTPAPAPAVPINWIDYEPAAEVPLNEQGKDVFVLMCPSYAFGQAALERLESTTLDKLSGGHEYVAFVFRYDKWDTPAGLHIKDLVGHTKEAHLVYFPADGSPKAYDGLSYEELDLRRQLGN